MINYKFKRKIIKKKKGKPFKILIFEPPPP